MKTNYVLAAMLISSLPAQAAGINLDGTWAAACAQVGGRGVSESTTFSGNHFDHKITIFDDSQCQYPSMSDEKTGTFTTKLGNFGVPGAIAIDFNNDADSNSAAGITYNILKVTGNTMYMGNDSFMEDERPTTLDMAVPLVKQ